MKVSKTFSLKFRTLSFLVVAVLVTICFSFMSITGFAIATMSDGGSSSIPKATATPTKKPTVAPTRKPTVAPTKKPTVTPKMRTESDLDNTPTTAPTKKPTPTPKMRTDSNLDNTPTTAPTKKPTPTSKMRTESDLDNMPTTAPTKKPTPTPKIRTESDLDNTPTRKPTPRMHTDSDLDEGTVYKPTATPTPRMRIDSNLDAGTVYKPTSIPTHQSGRTNDASLDGGTVYKPTSIPTHQSGRTNDASLDGGTVYKPTSIPTRQSGRVNESNLDQFKGDKTNTSNRVSRNNLDYLDYLNYDTMVRRNNVNTTKSNNTVTSKNDSFIASSNIKVYRDSSSNNSFGSVFAGDKVEVISNDGKWAKVKYAITDNKGNIIGYKEGYVKTSELPRDLLKNNTVKGTSKDFKLPSRGGSYLKTDATKKLTYEELVAAGYVNSDASKEEVEQIIDAAYKYAAQQNAWDPNTYVDPNWIITIAAHEARFNKDAVNSKSGAYGLGQFLGTVRGSYKELEGVDSNGVPNESKIDNQVYVITRMVHNGLAENDGNIDAALGGYAQGGVNYKKYGPSKETKRVVPEFHEFYNKINELSDN